MRSVRAALLRIAIAAVFVFGVAIGVPWLGEMVYRMGWR